MAGDERSPCSSVCRMDPGGLCQGCQRALPEIAAWGGASRAERGEMGRQARARRAWFEPDGRLRALMAIGPRGAAGISGRLPWRLPGELAWFKQASSGLALGMGRSSWEALGRDLPGGRCWPWGPKSPRGSPGAPPRAGRSIFLGRGRWPSTWARVYAWLAVPAFGVRAGGKSSSLGSRGWSLRLESRWRPTRVSSRTWMGGRESPRARPEPRGPGAGAPSFGSGRRRRGLSEACPRIRAPWRGPAGARAREPGPGCPARARRTPQGAGARRRRRRRRP